MDIDNEYLDLIENTFVPLYNKFNIQVTNNDFTVSERNAIFYTSLINLIDDAIGRISEEETDAKIIDEIKKGMLNALLNKWKELDPSLKIDNEVIDFSNKIRNFSAE